jgi:hypothetical protein
MMRAIAAIAGGLVAWVLIATAANVVVRTAWPGYSEVELSMQFTVGMMLARLMVGVLSSLGAGLAVAWISRGGNRATWALAGILLAVFIPVHYGLWESFPIWYHVAFLTSLAVIPPLGSLLRTSGVNAEATKTQKFTP